MLCSLNGLFSRSSCQVLCPHPVTVPSVSSKTTVSLYVSAPHQSNFFTAHLHRDARMVVAQQVPQHAGGRWVRSVLTIAKLKRWSINYYIDTAETAERAAKDRARWRRSGGGLLRARISDTGVAVGRRHPYRRDVGRSYRRPARWGECRPKAGGPLARRRDRCRRCTRARVR